MVRQSPRLVVMTTLLALMPIPALAGQVTLLDGSRRAISISGEIVPGDEAAFHTLLSQAPTALIVLTGPGGRVMPALAIGREIRGDGLQTLVPEGASCASACALIWLAGTRRMLASRARLGLHALSTRQGNGGVSETHAFDDVLVHYLTELGYAFDATATIVNTPSALVRWYDPIELNASGIATEPVP